MLLMAEKVIRSGICLVVHMFVKTKNKYMKDYDPSTESLSIGISIIYMGNVTKVTRRWSQVEKEKV